MYLYIINLIHFNLINLHAFKPIILLCEQDLQSPQWRHSSEHNGFKQLKVLKIGITFILFVCFFCFLFNFPEIALNTAILVTISLFRYLA